MSDQFKAFTMMDEATRQSLLEGVEDCITPELEKEQAFLERIPCPKCATAPCQAIIDSKNIFGGPGVLPKKLLLCHNCGVEFEPHTGIQTNLGGVPKNEQELSRMFLGSFTELVKSK